MSTATITYKPRKSNGALWVGALALILIAAGTGYLLTTTPQARAAMGVMYYIVPVISFGLGAFALLLMLWMPSMRYEMDDAHLVLRFGPFKWIIYTDTIQSIRRATLPVPMTSSFRFPGLAVFGVPYPGEGTVKMCATSVSKDILLIQTSMGKFGLTPADENGLVTELRKRMEA